MLPLQNLLLVSSHYDKLPNKRLGRELLKTTPYLCQVRRFLKILILWNWLKWKLLSGAFKPFYSVGLLYQQKTLSPLSFYSWITTYCSLLQSEDEDDGAVLLADLMKLGFNVHITLIGTVSLKLTSDNSSLWFAQARESNASLVKVSFKETDFVIKMETHYLRWCCFVYG